MDVLLPGPDLDLSNQKTYLIGQTKQVLRTPPYQMLGSEADTLIKLVVGMVVGQRWGRWQ